MKISIETIKTFMIYFSFAGLIVMSIAIYLIISNQSFILENQDKGLGQLDNIEKNMEGLTENVNKLVIDSS